MLAKLAWNVIHNSTEPYAQLLKAKYFPYHDLKYEPPPVHNNSSWIWQSIAHGVQIVQQLSKWQVGRGDTINIWKHNWTPSESGALYNWDELNTNDIQWVSQLMISGTSQWDIPLLHKLFTTTQVNSILTIPIDLQFEDTLVWPLTSIGKFTTRYTYNHLCNVHSTPSAYSFNTNFWLKFWKLHISYKLQIFPWELIHNFLPVRANLHHTDIVERSCILCNASHIEDINHLFFGCDFAKAIWRICLPQHCHCIYQFQTLNDWFASWTSLDAEINFSSEVPSIQGITAILRHILKFRCQVIFQQAAVNVNSVLYPLFKYLSDITTTTVSASHHIRQSRHHVGHMHHWVSPPPDMLKMNIDASFAKSFHLAGIVMILRNSTGAYIVGRGLLKRAIHPNQAETWALLEAMPWALNNR